MISTYVVYRRTGRGGTENFWPQEGLTVRGNSLEGAAHAAIEEKPLRDFEDVIVVVNMSQGGGLALFSVEHIVQPSYKLRKVKVS